MKPVTIRSLSIVLMVLCGLPLLGQAGNAGKEAAGSTAAKPQPSFSVKVNGHGAPMILIPGMSSSGDTWNATVAHFQDHYTCYVLTLAGFAGQPPIQAPLLSTVRDDLATYIEQHHLQKPVIVGHSLGGSLAMDLAGRHPDLVGPVVIVDSLPFDAGAWFRVNTLDEAQPMIAGMRHAFDRQTHDQYEQQVRSAVYTKSMVTNPSDLQTLIRWGLASDPKTVSSAMFELLAEDLRPQLANIKSPTLVLGTWRGIHDQLEQNGIATKKEDFVETFQQQYSNLPQLHFALAETARHFIMWDDPKWFFQQLDTFLANPAAVVQDRGFATKNSTAGNGTGSL